MKVGGLLLCSVCALMSVVSAVHEKYQHAIAFSLAESIPVECNEIVAFSVTAFMCPELESLYVTKSLMNNGLQ